MLCSQYIPEGWHQIIGASVYADTILDRITHNKHTIYIKDNLSMRK